jgi:hypothetical protein
VKRPNPDRAAAIVALVSAHQTLRTAALLATRLGDPHMAADIADMVADTDAIIRELAMQPRAAIDVTEVCS